MNTLATKYDPKEVEDKWYKYWTDHDLFKSVPDEREPYTIVIPPPNVTGVLHMGHMLNETIQDILVRRARMEGKNACWVPGTDHASIATEAKVVNRLAQQGIRKSDLTRDEFLKHAWDWTHEHGGIILKQLRRLGASCDWSRTSFTMDEKRSESVIKVFCDLYDKGLIYRGLRMVNWDPKAQTALSNEEVIYRDEKSKLYHLKYYLADQENVDTSAEGNVVHKDAKGYYAVVATTRPETIMGDTAMCINPKDPKNQWLKGHKVIVPLVGRVIPVIEDRYVDIEFGTGCLKVTPAHDTNDHMLGKTHNLETIDIFNADGTISDQSPLYVGMDRMDCRKQIVKDLDSAGLLDHVEDYENKVGYSERNSDTAVEPRLCMQWFLKMQHFADIALPPVMEDALKFYPEKYKNTYKNWLDNIQDWCISRQLWWGHRIPAYYCENPDCGHIEVTLDPPEKCPVCGAKVHQDEDVLDTWFSSGMWPFSTLGWPDKTPELEYFYPTSTLVTGYDIIFFWVARMIVFGTKVMGKIPFDTVYVHGIVRDELGRKMSKSLGNGIDPLEIIKDYGADSLRFSLVTGNSAGNDMRFSNKKVEAARNFCNKVYNASRFVQMNIGDEKIGDIDMAKLDIADKWILHRLNAVAGEVTSNMDNFELNVAAQKVYDFIWTEFCDWYIEMAKPRLYGEDESDRANVKAILVRVLGDSMKLLHPFMPFITEELYQSLPNAEETIMRASWPKYTNDFQFAEEAEEMEGVMDVIRSIRNLRAEMNVPPARRTAVYMVTPAENVPAFEMARAYLMKLAGAENVIVQQDKNGIPKGAVNAVCAMGEAFIPLDQLIDIDKEIERVNKEINRMKGEVARAEGKLGNPGFVAKAPEKVINEEKNKLDVAKDMLAKLEHRLAELQK